MGVWGRPHRGQAQTRVCRGPCVVIDPAHAEKLHAREPGDLRTACPHGRPAREGCEPHVWRVRGGGVGLRCSTDEPAEQRRASGRRPDGGGWGGKDAGQGEHRPGPHAFDTVREKSRIPGTGRCASSSQGKEEGTIHRAVTPSDARAAPGKLLRSETGGRAGSGRSEMERVRGGAGRSPTGPARPHSPRRLPGAAISKGVHPEGRRAAAPVGDRGAGRQDRPAGRGHDSQ